MKRIIGSITITLLLIMPLILAVPLPAIAQPQEALSDAVGGGTGGEFWLNPNTLYTGGVTITGDTRIYGQGAMVDLQGSEIEVRDTYLYIERCTITNGTFFAGSVFGALEFRDGASGFVYDNVIVGNNDNGIIICESSDVVIKENSILHNHDTGIKFTDSTDITILENIIVGNGEEIYSSNDECGIYGDNEVLYNDDPNSQHNIRIKGNKIAANVNHGIYLEYVNGVSISSNLISSNIGDGISLYKCPIVSITHNKILVNEYIYENNAGTDECGIHYVGDSLWNLDEIALSLTISNNKIMGNIGAGVHIENTENIVITYNEILWNQGSGIEINRHHYMGPTGNDGEFLMVKNVLIAYNVISENGGIGYMLDLGPDQFNSMSMGDGIYMDMISEVEIIYNKITGNRGRGIGIGEGIVFTIAITANSNNEVHVGEDLLIKGNIISGNEYAGIYVDHFDSPVTIEWNTILGNGNEGIHLFHVENPQILHNTIMYTFTTFIRNGPVCGILSIECMGVRIAYNTIAYNMIHNIDILHSNDVIIEHNNIIGAIENGINIDSLMEEEVGCEDVTIQYNKICDNKGDGINWYRSFGLISNNMIGYSGSLSGNENGIFLHDCRSNNEGPTTISDNTILGNYDGIQCRGSDPTIIGNYIANNVYGIWLDIGQGDPSYPLIGGSPTNRNYIIRNYKDGICIADTISDPVINYNNIYDNVGYGVYCKFPLDAIDAENNFWGDISGPGNPATFGVGPGSGDEISNNFTYSPWLVSIIP